MPFVVPGSVSGRESFALDGLELNDATSYKVEALTFAPAYDETELVITLRVRVMRRSTADVAHQARGVIGRKLDEAENLRDGLPLVWTPQDTSADPLTFYVLKGRITEVPTATTGEGAGWLRNMPLVAIQITCKPYGYGAEETTAAVTTTFPLGTITVPDVKGDVPAEGRLVITSAILRKHAEWGLEQRHYDPSTDLMVGSSELSLTGAIGTSATRTGAYGLEVVRAALTDTPAVIAYTPGLSHVGRFRVRLRGYAATTGARIRVAAQTGASRYRANSYVTPPVAGAFSDLDLGIVDFPEVTLGAQQSFLRFDGLADDPEDFDADLVLLIPVGEGYGLAADSDHVIPAGGSVELRHDGVLRENTAGTTYGAIETDRGGRVFIPVAGDADRTTRIAFKVRRNLPAEADANVTDSTTAQLFYRPRYRMPRSDS